MRTEQDIFEELRQLCTSPGYIQALAFICLNDNFVWYAESGISADDLLKKYSWDRLIRAEIMILVGLFVKGPIDGAPPTLDTCRQYIEDTYRLMEELRRAISPLGVAKLENDVLDALLTPSSDESVLREPIQYSGESAYSFQFRDLAVPKYTADDDWLKEHKGFRIAEARDVVRSFTKLQDESLTKLSITSKVQALRKGGF